MFPLMRYEPIDYLVIGHLTCDLTPSGQQLGGTSAYSSLTAQSLGLRPGIVTSWGTEISNSPIENIPVVNFATEHSTTFENLVYPHGRVQYIHHIAPRLNLNLVPEIWRKAPIVHLGPVAQEVDPSLVRNFGDSMITVTPQGWLRSWDDDGKILVTEWPEASFVLERVGAAVFSAADIGWDESRIEEMAVACHILAVTEGEEGSRVYWNGDVRRYRTPMVQVMDTTGAGDIYATAFFIRLYQTRDPWESGRFATQLAAISVTRPGLSGIPTSEEIEECRIEVL